MASKFTETEFEADEIDLVEVEIHECFDELVLIVNRRREALVQEYRERRDEMQAREADRYRTKQQLIETKSQVQDGMIENRLHSFREKMTKNIETQLKKLEVTVAPMELEFQCETSDLEESISQLGKLVEKESLPDPDPDPISNYPARKEPRISVCEKGTGPGQLKSPIGVAYGADNHLIYVTDISGFKLVVGRVCIFTEEGEYLNSFGQDQLLFPVGVAIFGEDAYVSDPYQHAIFQYKLPDYELVTIVGKKGSGDDKFSSPQRITMTSNGDLYVADCDNNRVVVLDFKLKFIQSIQHSKMTQPIDVKVLNDAVYVLSAVNNPCIHVFDSSGVKLRSFIARGRGGQKLREVYCFCFDKQDNMLISDYTGGLIKVFSSTGTFMHTLGATHDRNLKIKPRGIAVTSSGKIACSSIDTRFRLHIFF